MGGRAASGGAPGSDGQRRLTASEIFHSRPPTATSATSRSVETVALWFTEYGTGPIGKLTLTFASGPEARAIMAYALRIRTARITSCVIHSLTLEAGSVESKSTKQSSKK